MHSTSEFAKIVLSKCVIHAWVVMVAWTLRGIPFQVGERSNDLISEFTFFNLVIRLSKVKQSALFQFSPIGRVSVEQLPAASGNRHFKCTARVCRLQPRQPFLFHHCSSICRFRHLQHQDFRHRPCLQVWWLFFLWSLVRFKCARNSRVDYLSRLQGCDLMRRPLSLSREICTSSGCIISLTSPPWVPYFMSSPFYR